MLATRMYELSSTETLSLTVAANGTPFLVNAALGDTRLDLKDRVAYSIQPHDLHGVDAYHLIELRLFFSDPSAANVSYSITVADQNATLEQLPLKPVQAVNPARVSLEFWVV